MMRDLQFVAEKVPVHFNETALHHQDLKGVESMNSLRGVAYDIWLDLMAEDFARGWSTDPREVYWVGLLRE